MDNFIQITVFCPPEPRIGAFVYRNAGKVYTCFYYFLKKKMFFLILRNTKEVTAVMRYVARGCPAQCHTMIP